MAKKGIIKKHSDKVRVILNVVMQALIVNLGQDRTKYSYSISKQRNIVRIKNWKS